MASRLYFPPDNLTGLLHRCNCSCLTLGERIKVRRNELGLSQAQLAQLAGSSESVICRIERGERYPDGALTARIAKVLDRRVSELLGEVAPSDGPPAHSEDVQHLHRTIASQREELGTRERMITFLQSVIDRLLPSSREGGS
ncbi:MAG: helix-turn-helix transcriptional regulator [Flavobacteriales bacterium]|nr:helix-turn-helix transcriptional regulator [Flavobacteriales bacterium]